VGDGLHRLHDVREDRSGKVAVVEQ
jgi:hypothetical protein